MTKVYFDKDLRAATAEQARLIALVWANDGRLPVGNFKTDAMKQLIALKWLVATGQQIIVGGMKFDLFLLKDKAIHGLEKYFRNERLHEARNAANASGVPANQTFAVRFPNAAPMDVQE